MARRRVAPVFPPAAPWVPSITDCTNPVAIAPHQPRYNNRTMSAPIPSTEPASARAVPIFALPDHQVILGLLPDIEDRRWSTSEAVRRLGNRQLVPVAINPDPDHPLLYFADLGSHPYREWQHIHSIRQLAQAGRIVEYFSTPAALLDCPNLVAMPRQPRGFILHVSRCGSTLLGKALVRADGVGVIHQPSVLQHGFWAWISGNWRSPEDWQPAANPLNRMRFQNLLNLLCQPRLADEKEIFIKFISWNCLYADFIRAAFPTVPAVFMYRHPVEVIASVLCQTSAVLTARGSRQAEFLTGASALDLSAMDDVAYLSCCYVRYIRAILNAQPRPALLEFSAFVPGVLERVLAAAFAMRPDNHQLGRMREQFSIYSKDDLNQRAYRHDSSAKRASLNHRQRHYVEQYCHAHWQELLNASQNII